MSAACDRTVAATESDASSTGPTADESSDGEEFLLPINGGRGRYHRTVP